MIIQHPLNPGCSFGHDKKKQHAVWWTLIIYKVQMCHLVLWYPKTPIQNPTTVFPVMHWPSPLNHAVRVLCKIVRVLVGNIHLKRCGPQMRSNRYKFKKKKKKKRSMVNFSISAMYCLSLNTREKWSKQKCTAPALLPLFTAALCQ